MCVQVFCTLCGEILLFFLFFNSMFKNDNVSFPQFPLSMLHVGKYFVEVQDLLYLNAGICEVHVYMLSINMRRNTWIALRWTLRRKVWFAGTKRVYSSELMFQEKTRWNASQSRNTVNTWFVTSRIFWIVILLKNYYLKHP